MQMKMNLVNTNGLMVVSTWETGTKVKKMVKVCTHGKMVECIRAVGLTTRCMGRGSFFGQTVVNMKVRIKWIRDMDWEFTVGLTAHIIRVSGKRAYSTARVFTLCLARV